MPGWFGATFREEVYTCPAPPWPTKFTKSAGRSGTKLTADSIDTPFHYACKWCLKERKSRKIFSFFFVYIFWLSASQKYLLKVRGDNVFIYQNIIIHYKYLHNNIRTFVEFLDQSIYAFFCPAPLEKAPLRTSLPKSLLFCVDKLSSSQMVKFWTPL